MSKNTNTNVTVTRGPGRPPKTVKFPSQGSFTVNQAIKLNSGKTCGLTVRKQINTGVATGNLVKLAENLALEGAGRPAFRFMTKARYEANQKVKARKSAPLIVA